MACEGAGEIITTTEQLISARTRGHQKPPISAPARPGNPGVAEPHAERLLICGATTSLTFNNRGSASNHITGCRQHVSIERHTANQVLFVFECRASRGLVEAAIYGAVVLAAVSETGTGHSGPCEITYFFLSQAWCLTTPYGVFGSAFGRYAEAEKTNGRWAMMAVAGILFTEALGFSDKWFNTGYEARDQAPLPALIAMEALVMGFIETKRLQGFKETGKVRPMHTPDQHPWLSTAMPVYIPLIPRHCLPHAVRLPQRLPL